MIIPLICGLISGAFSLDLSKDIDDDTPSGPMSPDDKLVYFGQISLMYLVSLSLITASFSAGLAFVLNQMVADKESKIRETLKIMSMKQSAYALSYLVLQSTFVFFTTTILTLSFLMGYENPVGVAGQPRVLFFGTLLLGLAMLCQAMCI